MSSSSASSRRRADAVRSSAAVLHAAIDLLGRRPQANMEEIAAAAGVARQTVYAHYSSRDRLVAAVVEHITADVVAAFDRLDVDRASPVEALDRWLQVAWHLLVRYPVLLTEAVAAPPGDDYERHLPISERLIEILEQGRRTGGFDDQLPVRWLVSAIIGLGHTAGQEAAAGRMSMDEAGEVFRHSVLRLCASPRTSHA